MLDRTTLLALFIGGMFVAGPIAGCAAQSHPDNAAPTAASATASAEKGEKEEKDDDEKEAKAKKKPKD